METKRNVETGDCSYCDQKETSVRGTPFLADIAEGARMCWRCWGISERASSGEIGRFWDNPMPFSIGKLEQPHEGQTLIEGIVENALKSLPEDMLYAMLAGCEIESDYDADKGALKFKTKYPIAIVKIDGRVTVYEDSSNVPKVK